MDKISVVKILGDSVKPMMEGLFNKLTPEFCEKNFGKIALSCTGIVAIVVSGECFEYYIEKSTARDILVAAINKDQLDINTLSASERKALGLPAAA